MSGAGVPTEYQLWIEIAVAGLIVLVTLGAAMAMLRERHRDVDAWHVWVGAAIQGAIYGAIIGFLVLPVRFTLMGGEAPTLFAGVSAAAAFAVIIAMRRGVFAHLPFLGPQVKAFRRASLRRVIEVSNKQLESLLPDSGMARGVQT